MSVLEKDTVDLLKKIKCNEPVIEIISVHFIIQIRIFYVMETKWLYSRVLWDRKIAVIKVYLL